MTVSWQPRPTGTALSAVRLFLAAVLRAVLALVTTALFAFFLATAIAGLGRECCERQSEKPNG